MTIQFDVKLTNRAFDDLVAIRRWVADRANDDTARAFIDRIEAKLATLENFPQRGTPRPEVRDDVRSINFERNYIIVYHIETQLVWIDRVVNGRRELNDLN